MKRLQSARQTTVTEVRMLAADPYITKRYIADRYHVSVRTVCNWIAELDQYVQSGRYSDYTILDGCGVVYINYLAFIDYLKYRDKLRAKKTVPPFDPSRIAKYIGWGTMTPEIQ
nr:MAG TPA: Redirecting phage packaging protein C packaging protein, DNA Binding [Caudoviricetes sp.]